MKRLLNSWRAALGLGLAVLLVQGCMVETCAAYSVLTHEQVVDLVWKDNIIPLLKKRYAAATDDDLKKAHAFAYGGSVMQDMGYYPFGNKYFSDLTHYVRSGDFIVNMINEASDLNEYAFALGALAHYSADNCGHPTVNKAVGIEFPKLRKKYGDVVTYEDNPKAHIRTEFGFDVTQVAKNRYTSDRYHDFIGFEIAKPVLERAFQDTYGEHSAERGPHERGRSGLRHFPAGHQPGDPGDDPRGAHHASQRVRKGNAKFSGAPVSLLFVTRKLPEGVGQGLPAAGLRNPRAGVLSQIRA